MKIETLFYVGQGCTGVINCLNSSFRSDIITLEPLPPTSPNIFLPIEGNFSGNIQINYTEALLFNGISIDRYNITLVDGINFDFLSLIVINDEDTLGHLFITDNVSDGSYRISVEACDTNDLCSVDFSELFLIDRHLPEPLILEPINNTIYTNTTAIFSMVCNDSNLFGFDFSVTNEKFKTN